MGKAVSTFASRKANSQRKRRAVRRSFNRAVTTVDRHVVDVNRWQQQCSSTETSVGGAAVSAEPGATVVRQAPTVPNTRRHRRIFTTVRCEYAGVTLLTVGYGLHVIREFSPVTGLSLGFGLKTVVDIAAGVPITQYEGEILSRDETNRIRETGETSKSSHFATPIKGGPSINGYQLEAYDQSSSTSSATVISGRGANHFSGYSVGRRGDPVILTSAALKGKGGGSFANHKDSRDGLVRERPNAELQPDRFIGKLGSRDATALFLVAICDIKAGEFVHVSYSDMFVCSSKSNILFNS